ncbi:hypothetical protein XELAEV_18017188mg [Xenopus laevis]|uniref:Liver-expressed antimicrobial peptide 2 n=3 Tax=Xenopus laevis TaxID=8355 RepID=A0A974DAS0_XENLA|nr:hypothetical protein XELAEV_18017188mg [Xenopus laevis]
MARGEPGKTPGLSASPNIMFLQPGKWILILVLCCLFTHQLEGACLINPSVRAAVRLPRMTPFWRGLSLRPLGASCRDASECLTKLCSKSRCSLKTFSN